MPAIGNLGLLIGLFLFVFALIGKSFFAGTAVEGQEPSRYNFNSMGESVLCLFILLSGENWNEIMYIVYLQHGIIAIIFFISAMVIGNFMLLNLFLAILLKYIEENEDENDDDEHNESEPLIPSSKKNDKKAMHDKIELNLALVNRKDDVDDEDADN